jgi:multidrug resistance efflux pump
MFCLRARLPELEATKKAAAAARDFKAAAEAAAEAKAALAEATAAEERAAALKQQTAVAAEEEDRLHHEATLAEAAVSQALAEAARARWRGLLGARAELQKQLSRAAGGGAHNGGACVSACLDLCLSVTQQSIIPIRHSA